MGKEEVISELEELAKEFSNLFSLFDSPKIGMSSKENIDFISQEYSTLKDTVKEKLDKLQKRKRNNELSHTEALFLLPALEEIFLHCDARRGSKDERALNSSIWDGYDYALIYLSQLKKN